MRFASAGLGMAQFYVNRGEAFGLRDLDQQLSRQLEQREEGDHQDRDPPGRLEQLGELEDAALAQPAQDAAHVLAHDSSSREMWWCLDRRARYSRLRDR